MSSTLGRIGRRLVSSLNVDSGRGAAAASFLGGGGRFFAKCRQPTTSILQLPSLSSSPPLAAATSTARYRYFSSASANASHHHPSSSRSLPAAVSKGAFGLLSPCFGFSCFHPQHQQLRLGGAGTLLLRQKHTLKTNRSVAKRIRVRGNGSLKRTKSGKSHNTGYKTRARVNRLGQTATITDKKMDKKLKRVLGVS